MKTTDDPLVQMQRAFATARQAFASDVDALLHNWAVYSASLEDLGDVGRVEALRALRAFVLERFDHHLALPARRGGGLMDLALQVVVATLASVGGIFLGAVVLLQVRRVRPRRDEHGVLTEAWRREHVSSRADR